MIAVIDTGGANLASVTNAINRLDKAWQLTTDSQFIQSADHVLLPGVGAAKKNWQTLKDFGLDELVLSLKQPVLGICVGMQLLFQKSEEGPTPCLGLIDGNVTHFDNRELIVPHMGWNQVAYRQDSPLFRGIKENSYFYFVHSYRGTDLNFACATTEYGGTFVATVQKDNFFGTQFHPEKSGPQGAKLLENFFAL